MNILDIMEQNKLMALYNEATMKKLKNEVVVLNLKTAELERKVDALEKPPVVTP